MSSTDIDQLFAEIDAAVHPTPTTGPDGRPEKTTARGLNAVLRSLATEIANRPSTAETGAAYWQDLPASAADATTIPDYVATQLSDYVTSADARLVEYVDGATETTFQLFTGTRTYALPGAAATVAYAKANSLRGVFVFRADVTEEIELLDQCYYDLSGFDSVISGGGQPNLSASAGVRTAVKVSRIIRQGTATGCAVLVSGAGTRLQLEGDVIVDSSAASQGLFVRDGGRLHFRGNIDARQSCEWPIAQHGEACRTDFIGNITTDTPGNCRAIFCLGGLFDFTGRIDVLNRGMIAQCHPDAGGNPFLRLNLLGSSTRWGGLHLHNPSACRFHIRGVVDMRESQSDDPNIACGLCVTWPGQVDVRLENVVILTKPGIPSVKGQTGVVVNFVLPVIGTFYATEPPAAGEFVLQNSTPFHFPQSGSGDSTSTAPTGQLTVFDFKAGDTTKRVPFFAKVVLDRFDFAQGGNFYQFSLTLSDGTVVARSASTIGAISVAIAGLTAAQVTAGYEVSVTYTGSGAVATAQLKTFSL